jgi:tripartite-type tricarboxylate transporter receptor subunit TctC
MEDGASRKDAHELQRPVVVMKLQGLAVVAGLFLGLSIPASGAASELEGLFKGKTISFVVGYGPGTGNDLWMRVVQRHLGRHLPGQPTIIPVNRPGAASLAMLNYIANVAPADGTVIGMPSRSLVTEPLLGNDQARFDATRLSWIGSATKDVSVCLTWHTSGIASLDDATKREVLVGSTGYAADSNIFPLLLNETVGTRFRPVLGYADSGAVGIAMERGELAGYCSFTVSAIKAARPQWLALKQVNILVQLALSSHPDLRDVPVIFDLTKDRSARQMLAFAFGPQEMGRPVVAPPGVPEDRLAALRDGFRATMNDPEFLEDARRSGLEILDPLSGQDVAQIVGQLYATPPEIIVRYREIRERRQ